MKEIIVKRDILGNYSGINLGTAYDLVTKQGYDYIGFECADNRVIQVVFPTMGFKADDEKMKEELMRYFKYVESITGIKAPEKIEF